MIKFKYSKRDAHYLRRPGCYSTGFGLEASLCEGGGRWEFGYKKYGPIEDENFPFIEENPLVFVVRHRMKLIILCEKYLAINRACLKTRIKSRFSPWGLLVAEIDIDRGLIKELRGR